MRLNDTTNSISVETPITSFEIAGFGPALIYSPLVLRAGPKAGLSVLGVNIGTRFCPPQEVESLSFPAWSAFPIPVCPWDRRGSAEKFQLLTGATVHSGHPACRESGGSPSLPSLI